MGSDCTQKRADCHETCEICLTPNLNECIVCKDGFTLINGYCVPCADCCATCEPANGTAANQCLSCHPGFGLDGNGQCKACHPACATCSNSRWARAKMRAGSPRSSCRCTRTASSLWTSTRMASWTKMTCVAPSTTSVSS